MAALALVITPSAVFSQTSEATAEPWTAENSDPIRLGWMQGFPPAPDKVIRGSDADFFSFPKLRWSVCHFQQLMPSVEISRGNGAPIPLARALDPNIDDIRFTPLDSDEPMTWKDSLAVNFTDGIVVLHKGTIVYESYDGGLTENGKHAAMSVTKSFVGLMAEILIHEGKLDEHELVRDILPELKDTAFGDATVRQVMDMTTSFQYSEDYNDPRADVWVYSAAGSPFPRPLSQTGPRTYYEYLQTVKPEGAHGEAFAYKTPNTDVLGWIVVRTAGKPFHELVSERLWSGVGSEQAAFITVDSVGTPFVGGGLNCGLRDLARVGQLLLNDGEFQGRQLFPASVIESIQRGGDRAAFATAGYQTLSGGSYRSMWWVFHDDHGAFAARGVHGQTIYIDPTADMVIARFASHPQAKNGYIDPTSLPAFRALADYLLERQ